MESWHTQDGDRVLAQLQSRPEGLTPEEAATRLAEVGPNQLKERGGRSPWRVLAEQFTEVMVIVLAIAAVVSFAIGETTDAAMILVIVVLNALLGFSQEYRAERAMAALRRLAAPVVRARRGGQVHEVASTTLVPGDVILLEAGNSVPADARVLEAINLRVEEAALTGESVPVDKVERALEGEGLPLGDRRNMVYMGTVVTYGRGTAVVAATGMATELGNIAGLLQGVGEEKTPLQRRMAELGKWLAVGALGIVLVVFALGLLRGEALSAMFLTAVSLAVAAVPEGLPAVVTIALALGAQRMVRRRALIRKLPAVETLGSVTTICSDKTGTLTENRMTVTVLDVAGQSLDLVEPLRAAGPTIAPGTAPLGQPEPTIAALLVAGALCNDATLAPDERTPGGYAALGDPTEGALVVAAARMGLWKGMLEQALPRLAEAPFTSERKRMTTLHRLVATDAIGVAALPQRPYLVFSKGAVEGVLGLCSQVWMEGHAQPIDDSLRARIRSAGERLAANGVRVLGVAIRGLDEVPPVADEATLERELAFVGLAGMIDPPRAEVRQAVAECRTAGIRPVMITGDHPLTALYIAQELGIVARDTPKECVLAGEELARTTVEALEERVEQVSVYARVSPEHKVKIVEALKRRGQIVAMTGDGVNDAPALKRADIGVAMGITGTDVSKEAADMVLLDDNFATIVHAIEEGRTIYDNILKFMRYIISSNVGEILMMLVAPLLGLPLPLTAVQLLWINLLTDGLPGLALGVEPAAPDTMRRPPRAPRESVLAHGAGPFMLGVGALLAGASLAPALWQRGAAGGTWQTMGFTTLALAQMGNALAIRSERLSIWKLGLLTNKPLLGAIGLTVLLQLAAIYVPFMQRLLGTQALSAGELGITLALSAVVFVAVEGSKLLRRKPGREAPL